MRQRKIRKIGGSLFIPLLKADIKDFGLKEGDEVDIDNLNTNGKDIYNFSEEQMKEINDYKK